MNTIDKTLICKSHLETVIRISSQALLELDGKKTTIERFAFTAVQKVYKVTLATQVLYNQLDRSQDFEFSLGILLRSVLMDAIMLNKLKSDINIFSDNYKNGLDQDAYKELNTQVESLVYKYLFDGTQKMIAEVQDSPHFSADQKKDIIAKLQRVFPAAYETKDGAIKMKSGFKFTLKDLKEHTSHPSMVTADDVNSLYSNFSKYDHLSHWTAAYQSLPWETRKGRIDTSILLLVLHLRDLLVIASDFIPDDLHLGSLGAELQKHLTDTYDPIIR
jgi:hypothetical protein